MRITTNIMDPSVTDAQRNEFFGEIMLIYEKAEILAQALEHADPASRDVQARLAIPLLTQVENATNIIAVHYAQIVHQGKAITPELQDVFELAFRSVFTTLQEFIAAVEEKADAQAAVASVPAASAGHGTGGRLGQRFASNNKPGTMQVKMDALAKALPAWHELLVNTRAMCDQIAGVGLELHDAGVMNFYAAVPSQGLSTSMARKQGLTLGPDDEPSTVIAQPGRAKASRLHPQDDAPHDHGKA